MLGGGGGGALLSEMEIKTCFCKVSWILLKILTSTSSVICQKLH